MTVLGPTPTMRSIDRIDDPSTNRFKIIFENDHSEVGPTYNSPTVDLYVFVVSPTKEEPVLSHHLLCLWDSAVVSAERE